jgi:hypothetical protein
MISKINRNVNGTSNENLLNEITQTCDKACNKICKKDETHELLSALISNNCGGNISRYKFNQFYLCKIKYSFNIIPPRKKGFAWNP